MKKKVFILGACTLLVCGCGKIPKLANGEEAVVTLKDDMKISANEFYEEIKNQYGLQTLANMIDKKIFELELKDELKDADVQVENAVKSFKANYTSNEELETAAKQRGYQDANAYIEAYREYVYLDYLKYRGTIKYVEDTIPEKDLKDYYENNIYPNMNISHIEIDSKASSTASDEDKKKAEEEAKNKAQEVINKLNQAKSENKDINETFKELAKEYSDDAGRKENGGDLGEINIGTLGSSYDELVKAAAKLKDGEYSTEVIKTSLGYHVILKTKTGTKQSYEEALSTIKEKISSEKMSKNSSGLQVEALQYFHKKYDLEVIDSEMKSQYSIYMNQLINSTTKTEE